MNAAERRAVALKFRSSQNVISAQDWSNNPEYVNPKPAFTLPHNPQNDYLRHGARPERDIPWTPENNYQIQTNPTTYLDIKDHPECVPTPPPFRACEVDLLFKNPPPASSHQHPLMHKMHTQYADVGATVCRNYDADTSKVCGISTKKEAGDTASAALTGCYEDKGYQLKNVGELTELKRGLVKVYQDKDTSNLPAAGTVVDKGERASAVLSLGYGTQLPNFDTQAKVTRNLDTDLSQVHGFKEKRDGERPVCIGGQRAGGDLNNYRRQ